MNLSEDDVQEQLKLFFEDKPLTIPLAMLNEHADFAKRIKLLNRNNERKAKADTPEHKARLKAYHKEYYSRPENLKRKREYNARPYVRARIIAYRNSEHYKRRVKEYHQRPEVIAQRKAYYKRPDVMARIKAYRERPDVKKRKKKAYLKKAKETRMRKVFELFSSEC